MLKGQYQLHFTVVGLKPKNILDPNENKWAVKDYN